MRRREVIAGLTGAAALPMDVLAQQTRPKRIGVVVLGGPHHSGVLGLREGLKAAGIEEHAAALVVRDARGDRAEVGRLSKELEREGADLIVTFGASAAIAAKQSTTAVPIVFAVGGDPVAMGLVESIPKPGGRLTGIHSIIVELTAKRLELLRQVVPTLRRVAVFYHPDNPVARASLASTQAAARDLGIEVTAREAASPTTLRDAVGKLRAGDADAIFFIADATVLSEDKLILERASALGIPVMAYELDLVAEGALAGYGVHYREFGRLAAEYSARILAGANPRDLPVQSLRPMLGINLRTARALGLEIPATLLARADEVIE